MQRQGGRKMTKPGFAHKRGAIDREVGVAASAGHPHEARRVFKPYHKFFFLFWLK